MISPASVKSDAKQRCQTPKTCQKLDYDLGDTCVIIDLKSRPNLWWQVSPTKNIIPRRLGKRSDFRQWFGSGSAELRLVTGQRWGRWLFTNGPVICEKMLGKLNEAIFRDDLCWKSMGPWVFSC